MDKECLIVIVLVFLSSSGTAAQNSSNNSSILSEIPEIEIQDKGEKGQANGEQSDIFWMLFFGIILAGVTVYSFDINPFYMVLLLMVSMVLFALFRAGIISF